MSGLFAGLFRRAPQVPQFPPKFPFTVKTNPYRCKRTWPPDFTKLSQKHQFRLERRYRRRSKLKWARPSWTKSVKLAQWGSILFVLIYGVLFLEIDEGRTPFDGIRQAFRDQMKAISPDRESHPSKDNSPVSSSTAA